MVLLKGSTFWARPFHQSFAIGGHNRPPCFAQISELKGVCGAAETQRIELNWIASTFLRLQSIAITASSIASTPLFVAIERKDCEFQCNASASKTSFCLQINLNNCIDFVWIGIVSNWELVLDLGSGQCHQLNLEISCHMTSWPYLLENHICRSIGPYYLSTIHCYFEDCHYGGLWHKSKTKVYFVEIFSPTATIDQIESSFVWSKQRRVWVFICCFFF